MAEMTKEAIVVTCKANGGYESPKLNDQLFLHCKGFMEIKNLELYTNVKVLWLEQNAITNLTGLDHQRGCLVSLFLQNNTIYSLQSLSATPLTALRVLNISHNYLTSLEGIAMACPYLETLQVSHNRIASLAACEELWKLSETLTSVDLSYNNMVARSDVREKNTEQPQERPRAESSSRLTVDHAISDGDFCATSPSAEKESFADVPPFNQVGAHRDKDPFVLVRFFEKLPNISVIYMHGNEVAHEVRNYRRNLILHLPNLTYLDQRPVFPEERRVVEAWSRGGDQAEAAERAAIRAEKREHLESCVRVLTDRLEGSREVRDRLTQQFERERAHELHALEQRRHWHQQACAAVEAAERSTRESEEKDEQNARWDLEALFEEEHKSLIALDEQRARELEQTQLIKKVTAEAARELAAEEASNKHLCCDETSDVLGHAPASPGHSFAANSLAMLLDSDDDILKEMEDTMQHVLYDVELSVRNHNDKRHPKKALDRAALKAVSGVNVGQEDQVFNCCSATEAIIAASYQYQDRSSAKAERATHDAIKRFGTILRQGKREEVWKQFRQWERRFEAA